MVAKNDMNCDKELKNGDRKNKAENYYDSRK